ncbi:MAG TPA: glycosyltransferase [Allosphingosinicella sp.]|jgi:glycosyltransferase involved in cell wall biosynthesis|uniref:glycosyltransferase n=1 Tax=Allosphingosinicella sp. TaxID=2823234 RepID=UPI002F26F227
MLRVLTLSTLFPNAAQPTLGVFVERQTLGLAAFPDVEVQVVSPVGLPPWPLSLHPHYSGRARLANKEPWKGVTVHRPRFRVLPRIGEGATARLMARALLPALRDLRKSFPFDVIDAEFFWPDGPAAMHLSRALGVPFSVKARGADIQYWGYRRGIAAQIQAAGEAAAGLLAVSKALKGVMIGLGMPDTIRVHHTGVELDRFRPIDRAAAKSRLGVAGPLLVSAGALIPRKGQAITIRALERLPGATLILVGEGADRPALERQIRAAGLETRVRLLGSRPHSELPELLGAADVMVLPSSSEGLANVWIEALACGTPIVISDVGGAGEVLSDESAGRIVAGEPDAIAAAVRDLLAAVPDPRAVRRSAERFTWERNAAELREHLRAIAGPA